MSEHYDEYGSSDSAKSAEEVRRNQERKLESAQYAMHEALGVQEKDGKQVILGFIPVSDQVASVAKPLINVVLPSVNEMGMEAAYKKTLSWSTNKELGHKWGLRVAGAVAVVLTAFRPILDGAHAVREYWGSESQLKKQYALVLEADKGAWKKNEVIKTARKKNWDQFKKKMWLIGADLPVLGITGYYAFGKYKNLAAEKTQQLVHELDSKKPNNSAKSISGFHDEMRTALAEEETKLRSLKDATGGKLYTDEQVKELLKDFKEDFRQDYHAKEQHKREQSLEKNDSIDDKVTQGTGKVLVAAVAEGVGNILKIGLKEGDKNAASTTAPEMAKELKNQIEQQCRNSDGEDCNPTFDSRNPDEILIPRMEGMRGRRSTLTLSEFLAAIVAQNELDHGRPPIGEVLMPELVKAVHPLAKMIANRQIDGDAIISLADRIITHKNGSRLFANEEQVKNAVKPLIPVMGTHEVSEGKDDFYKNFSEPEKIAAQIKENLKTKDSLFTALLPNSFLEQHGFKKESINALRKESYKDDAIYYFVAANAVHLAKKEGEQLKKDIGDKAAEIILSVAEKVKFGDMEALKVAVDGENKAVVLEAVRRAGLLEQTNKDGGKDARDYWNARAKEIPNVRKDIEAVARQKKEDENKSVQEEPDTKSQSEGMDGGGGDWSSNVPKKDRITVSSKRKPGAIMPAHGEGASESDHLDDILEKGFELSAEERLKKGRKASPEGEVLRR